MKQISIAAMLCAATGAVMVALQYLLSIQTALAGLFVFGIAFGMIVAGRMKRGSADATSRESDWRCTRDC